MTCNRINIHSYYRLCLMQKNVIDRSIYSVALILIYPMIMLWIFLVCGAEYLILTRRLRSVRAAEILKQRE